MGIWKGQGMETRQMISVCQSLGEKQGAGEEWLTWPTALDCHQGPGSQDKYSHWTAEETEAYGNVVRGLRLHS